MNGQDDDDRSHDPTQKRLQDARDKGDIPRSPDLTLAAAYGGFLLAALWGAGPLLQVADGGTALLSRADAASAAALDAGQPFSMGLAGAMILPLWPFFLVPGAVVLILLVAQQGIVVSGEKLGFKASRIDPLANARQKFGAEGIVDFGKSVIKLCLACAVLVWLVRARGDDILGAMTLGPAGVMELMLGLTLAFLSVTFGLQLVLGLADALWQRHRFTVRNRMTRQEVMDEAKDSDGDPHVRAQRRQKGQEIALNRMLADLPTADVVIVNPTHFAVALKWDRAAGIPPVCIAKGVDEVALRLRDAATAQGIPIRHDPPTARALYAGVKLGEPIRPDHYRAVAAAIRFAEAMRKKARRP